MVVNPSMLEKLGRQVRRENIRKVRIFGKDLCRGLFSNQARYLRPLGRMDVEQEGARQCIGNN